MSDAEKTILEEPDEEMTVTIETEDGKEIECEVLTIFEAMGRDYIAITPLEGEDISFVEDADDDESVIWFYRYSENPEDPNEEPELAEIEDDQEFEAVLDAFDEFLDELDFEEM